LKKNVTLFPVLWLNRVTQTLKFKTHKIMKKVAFITMIAACLFGVNTSIAHAASTNEKEVVETIGGYAAASFDETTETIQLRMSIPQGKEQVSIVLLNSRGRAVYKETAMVHQKGVQIDIPMANLAEGLYTLQVKGQSIRLSEDFKKK